MNKLQLVETFENCVSTLLSIDIPLDVDSIDTKIHLTKKNSYFGVCRHKTINGKLFHTIGINENFAKNGTEKGITNTIIHELLHTLPNCQDHGQIWKSYAAKVYTKLGYNIKRFGGDKTLQDRKCLCNIDWETFYNNVEDIFQSLKDTNHLNKRERKIASKLYDLWPIFEDDLCEEMLNDEVDFMFDYIINNS